MDDVALGSVVQVNLRHVFTEVPRIHFQAIQMTTPDPDFKNQVCLYVVWYLDIYVVQCCLC